MSACFLWLFFFRSCLIGHHLKVDSNCKPHAKCQTHCQPNVLRHTPGSGKMMNQQRAMRLASQHHLWQTKQLQDCFGNRKPCLGIQAQQVWASLPYSTKSHRPCWRANHHIFFLRSNFLHKRKNACSKILRLRCLRLCCPRTFHLLTWVRGTCRNSLRPGLIILFEPSPTYSKLHLRTYWYSSFCLINPRNLLQLNSHHSGKLCVPALRTSLPFLPWKSCTHWN